MHSNSHIQSIPSILAARLPFSKLEDTDYLAMLCHEIGTPLTALLGISQILSTIECSPQKKKECAAVLRDSSSMLMGLMNNLLDSSKLHNSKLELESIPFDLVKVVEEAKNIISLKAAEKGLDVHVHIDTNIPSFFRGDPLRIRQILLNLLGNAIKFTRHGTITLSLKEEMVSHERSEICITVSDTGVGIEKNQLRHIFGKYAQANSGIKQNYGGTGLGLFISQELAYLMGGGIKVESCVGKGSEFIVTLQLTRESTLSVAA